MIKQEYGEKGLSVACIGSSGEKLVKQAGIMNDEGRAAGRCGLGALMGSKKLKAVAVAGNKRAEQADSSRVNELAKEGIATINGNFISVAFREYGTLMYMDMGMTLGDVPAKYFQKNIFPAQKVSGQALRSNYTVENYACRGCPVGCGRTVKNFSKKIDTVDGPEYETVAAFGPLCMNTDYDSIIEANHLCNLHGLDTISTGVSIAYAMYLYEKKVLTKKKAGMEIKWGDGKTIVKLVKMIISQKGIGKILSQGTLAMAKEFKRSPEEAAQVKGLEMPMHDGRAFQGEAVSYATGPRGACHLKGDYYNIDLGSFVLEYELLPSDRLSPEGKAVNAAKYQSLKDLFDALTLCKFASLSVTQICQMLNAITGWDVTPEELLKTGDRSINIKRAISNKLGVTRKDDKLPKICLKALNEGSTDGIKPDMDAMLKEYYSYRKWDWETGKPSKEILLDLGLNQAAQDLHQ
jgi:aldehyde:ferredoxin oxidoreductase